ncbi:methyl-accepting chemotaxis protein [uncultured Tolumonas sp.]|uniref:methyl-accepting chemotaxis protein n=1 Tax=uncultured Tolumonas sp. TaxID=263765 RepID=UPI00292E23BF|nr:methyl-accepting chemotaxis protein [uncultured Tolumonas sp.]
MDSYNNKQHLNHKNINLSWFDRLSIKHKFLFLITGALLGLTFLTLFSIYSIKQISINGPIYARLKINQDLIADIMPPPMYLVDAAFQLQLFIQHAENNITREPYKEAYESDIELFKSANSRWETSALDPAMKSQISSNIRPTAERFITIANSEIIPFIEKNNKKPNDETLILLEDTFSQHRKMVDTLLADANTQNQLIEQDTAEQKSKIYQIEMTVALSLCFVFLGFIWRVYSSIKRMLGGEPMIAASVVSTISNGNLAKSIPIKTDRQHSLLGQMESMRSHLNDLIKKIQSSTHELHSVSDEVNQLSTQVLNASNTQSDAASSIAATVEEMTTTIQQISHNSEHVLTFTSEAEETAQHGVTLINALITNIDTISDEVNQVATEITALGDKSNAISTIVTTIKEIADQTNLLALNAAIEAARAGETGRGFAVVADEVRMLAERTAASTREVDSMIKSIQLGTQSVVKQIYASVEHVNGGVAAAERASHGMQAISEKNLLVMDSVRNVMNALSSQTGAMSEAARNVEYVARMSEDNNQSIKSVNNHLVSLTQLAVLLETYTDKFVVSHD